MLAGSGLILQPRTWLVWNRTGSAPQGLYRLSGEPPALGRWVVVSNRSEAGNWAETHGYVGPGWPLLKRVAALPGSEVCRIGATILIDGNAVAVALQRDSEGRTMPVWSGCHLLGRAEVFVLNDDPRSLDGRYFGPLSAADLDGVAIPIFLVTD